MVLEGESDEGDDRGGDVMRVIGLMLNVVMKILFRPTIFPAE